MSERWVLNASPLIVLAKIGQQHLFTQLATEVVVPWAVVAEINAGPVNDAARPWLAASPLPTIPAPTDPDILAWDLGSGESAVLSYAYRNQGWTAVLDDRAARRCAHALDIPLIGTLGVILRARQMNLIPAVVPVLKSLQAVGLHLDDRVLQAALQAVAGEDWE